MTTPLSDYQAARLEAAHRAYCDYMRDSYGLPEFDDEGWFLYKDDKAAAVHSQKRIIAALLAADAVPRPTQGDIWFLKYCEVMEKIDDMCSFYGSKGVSEQFFQGEKS